MLQQLIAIIVYWLILPGITLAVFGFGLVIRNRTSDSEHRTSATAGLWAGLVLLAMFAVSQMEKVRTPTFDLSQFPGLDPAPAAMGVALGFAFLWGIRFLVPTRLVGLIVLVLTATSSVSLYSYVFIESLRGTVLFLALGVAFGALVHVVFFPSSVHEITNEQ